MHPGREPFVPRLEAQLLPEESSHKSKPRQAASRAEAQPDATAAYAAAAAAAGLSGAAGLEEEATQEATQEATREATQKATQEATQEAAPTRAAATRKRRAAVRRLYTPESDAALLLGVATVGCYKNSRSLKLQPHAIQAAAPCTQPPRFCRVAGDNSIRSCDSCLSR